MDLKLQEKCAVVTGGTRNLGRAISLGFLKEGANVVATYLRDTASAEDLLAAVPPDQKNNIRVHKLDVSSEAECREVCSVAKYEFGGLDVLVNNAAIIYHQSPDAITDEDFDLILHNTLRSTLYMTRASFASMKVLGGGRIVNISTAGVYTGNPVELLYLCAKGGVEVATRAFARLGASYGITVNAIAPHIIDAGMGKETVSRDPTILNRIPLNRMGRVEEFVNLVLFLSSSVCEYMTGQVVHLNGGRLMQ
jgi:3-oxoacyl-[acyl-carrier protein] reductase